MNPYNDVKSPGEYEELLPQPNATLVKPSLWNQRLRVVAAFVAGILTCFSVLSYVHQPSCAIDQAAPSGAVELYAAPWAGSSEVHHYPPASPTNVNPSLFPTSVGYAGTTATGAEPAIVVTAPSYPVHTGAPNLVAPSFKGHRNHTSSKFDIFRYWGNLSPWFSVERGAFGLDSSPEVPDTCRITGLHLLHRHGARYPSHSDGSSGPAGLASRLNEHAAEWKAKGHLAFLNTWTYKLGEELLTPFGRQQLYDLGVSTRLKYGFLLKNFSETNTIPVFRTESQNRMLDSALNFAIGFFGYPFEGQYQQSITIENTGINNTLAPYMTCPNFYSEENIRGFIYARKWAEIYLEDARHRLQKHLHGYHLTIDDIYSMQETCAYETVAIGYSKFCELFTEEEWEGYDYSLDLGFWYSTAWGSPVGRVLGIGYVQELVARLTHTPIAEHNSSTNATLDDNATTFPLDQSLYVDATHEITVLNVLTALNLSNFAAAGPLPYTHIPRHRSFKTSHLAPFATNVHFQLLSCAHTHGPQVRIIVNDGVVPLTSLRGCPHQPDGLCPLDTFVAALSEIIQTTDWQWGCHGNWSVAAGDVWNTTTGSYPPRPV